MSLQWINLVIFSFFFFFYYITSPLLWKARHLLYKAPVAEEVFLCWTGGKALDKSGLAVSLHTGSHGVTVTSFRKSAISLFLPVSSPQQSCVYQNVQWGWLSRSGKMVGECSDCITASEMCGHPRWEKRPSRKHCFNLSAKHRQKSTPCQEASE